jgi:ribonuclease HI
VAKNMRLTIFTDGASRGNPGPSSYGFVILDARGKVLYKEGKYIGQTTNNVAEYRAVLAALQYVKDHLGAVSQGVELLADSKLVAEQLSGRYKIKAAHLKPIIEKIKVLSIEVGGVSYGHIPRSQNSVADSLANQALDLR